MRAHTRFVLSAFLGLTLVLAACSSDSSEENGQSFGEAPDSLAFSTPGACAGDIIVSLDAFLAEGFVASAGPYPANVPAGTYDIQMESWADLDDPLEPNERWYFTGNGYTSPLIADPGDDRHVIRQTFPNQQIPNDITSVTVSHMLPGDDVSNSVVAKCISFTLVQSQETTTTTTTAAPTTAAPTTEAPTTAAPTTVAETTTTEEPDDNQVLQAATTSTTAAPATTAAPTTAAPTTATPTTAAAQNAAAQNPDTLALTGPSDLAASLLLTGLALVIAGYAALRASRRVDNAESHFTS